MITLRLRFGSRAHQALVPSEPFPVQTVHALDLYPVRFELNFALHRKSLLVLPVSRCYQALMHLLCLVAARTS